MPAVRDTGGSPKVGESLPKPRFPFWFGVLIVIVAVALVGGGVWFHLSQTLTANQKVKDELSSIAQLKVSEIVQWRAERLGDGASMTDNRLLAEDVERWMETRDPALTRQLLLWFESLQEGYGYSDVCVVDLDGIVLLALEEEHLTHCLDTAELEGLATARQEGRPVLTDLHRSPDGRSIEIQVVAPLLIGDAGGGLDPDPASVESSSATGDARPIAAVVMTADAAKFLYPLVNSWPTASDTAESLLLRRDGDQVLFLNELRHQANTALSLTLPLAGTDVVGVQIVLGGEGIVEGLDYRGVEVLAAGSAIPDSTWFLVAKEDRSEALAPAWISAFVLILMLALAPALGVGVWANWQFRQKRHYQRAYETEAERRVLLSRFGHISSQANDAIVTGALDGKIVDVNNRAIALFGYSSDEFMNLTFADLLPAERQEGFKERLRESAKPGALARESVHVKKDGTRFPVEISAAPLDEDGERVVQVIIRDITERKRAEEALRRSEQHLRSLFANMTEASALHELVRDAGGKPCDYRVVDVNPAFERIVGRRREDVVGVLSTELYGVPAAPFLERFARVAAGGAPEKFSASPLGGDRTFEVSVVPWGEGGFATMFEDITDQLESERERTEFERRLQQTQRLESLGVMAGGIAHDFNNILMAVLGHADLARMELPPTSPVRESIQEIIKASRKASELCRQMLAYSGHGRLTVEMVDVGQVAGDMVQLLRTTVSKKIILNLNVEENLPPINADRGQLTQVIMNLVLNAAEAIGEQSGVITVSTGAKECSREYLSATYLDEGLDPGLYVILEVSDTGCGMDEDAKSHLFEPFYTTKFTGRGLGLSAVLGIVRRHKGAIVVYSEVGQGSTFKVLLPAAEGEETLGRQPAEEPEAQWQGEGTVLLVDDEESVRALGKRMLERLGFTVLTASDGQEAVEVYEAHGGEIELVLLDLTMPQMNGEETFTALQRIDPAARVVMSSGYTETDIASRFAERELAGFVQKPYTLDVLRERLRAVLGDLPGDQPGDSGAT